MLMKCQKSIQPPSPSPKAVRRSKFVLPMHLKSLMELVPSALTSTTVRLINHTLRCITYGYWAYFRAMFETVFLKIQVSWPRGMKKLN